MAGGVGNRAERPCGAPGEDGADANGQQQRAEPGICECAAERREEHRTAVSQPAHLQKVAVNKLARGHGIIPEGVLRDSLGLNLAGEQAEIRDRHPLDLGFDPVGRQYPPQRSATPVEDPDEKRLHFG